MPAPSAQVRFLDRQSAEALCTLCRHRAKQKPWRPDTYGGLRQDDSEVQNEAEKDKSLKEDVPYVNMVPGGGAKLYTFQIKAVLIFEGSNELFNSADLCQPNAPSDTQTPAEADRGRWSGNCSRHSQKRTERQGQSIGFGRSKID